MIYDVSMKNTSEKLEFHLFIQTFKMTLVFTGV